MLGGNRHNMVALLMGMLGASMGGAGFEAREARREAAEAEREAAEAEREAAIDTVNIKPSCLCFPDAPPEEVDRLRAQRAERKRAAWLKRQPKS